MDMPEDRTTKSERLNLRLCAEADQLIRQGATLSGQDVTSFMLSAALDRARSLVIEDSLVRLGPRDARDLADAIDRGASPVPQLVELLRRAGDARGATHSSALTSLVD